jgi:hypothetical protein
MIEITDLALASYYKMMGKKLVKITKIKQSPNRQASFTFDMDYDEHSDMSLEYVNSDFARYDEAQRQLKKLIH